MKPNKIKKLKREAKLLTFEIEQALENARTSLYIVEKGDWGQICGAHKSMKKAHKLNKLLDKIEDVLLEEGIEI